MEAAVKNREQASGHPIAVVSERTGLSQDVLRAWERRYGVVEPSRGPGGQRLYSDADIRRLTLLNAAVQGGRSISHIAGLPAPELELLVAEDAAAREQRMQPLSALGAVAEIVAGALGHARDMNPAALDEVLRRAAASLGTIAFAESVLAPFLRRVGDEWHAGRFTPAQEHLASGVVDDIVSAAMRSIPVLPGAPTLLTATLNGDRHGLGAALVGAAAAVHGWNVVSLGSDLPAADISDAARRTRASAIAISIVYAETNERVVAELRTIRAAAPAGIPIIVGGSAARVAASELNRMGVIVETSITGLLDQLRRFDGRRGQEDGADGA
jgi:DNA-binding transcriptional MerR regulator/methylmalonyl-CoA mutase cobalamin-binding subunit